MIKISFSEMNNSSNPVIPASDVSLDNVPTAYNNVLLQPPIPPSPWISGGTLTASSVLLPQQLHQTDKHIDLTPQPKAAFTPSVVLASEKSETIPVISEASRPSSYIVR